MIGLSDISSTIPTGRAGETGQTGRVRRKGLAATMALVLILLLSGCGDRGDVGIFASIEREEKIEKSNLPEVSTAGSMVYDAVEDKYYVALGQLYARDRTDNDWDDVGHPSGYEDGHTLDIVSVNGIIYVAFFDTLSTKAELFTLNPSNDNFTKVWNPGKEISKLIGIDPDGDGTDEELFAVTVDSNKRSYNLVFEPQGAATQVLTDVPKIIDGAAAYWDGSGAYYYFVASGAVFESYQGGSGSTGTPGDIAPSSDHPSGMVQFSGVTFVPNAFPTGANEERLYLSSPKGKTAFITDWTGTGTWQLENDDNDRRYTDIAYVDFPDFTGLVVGLDTREASSGGYYEVDSGLGTDRPDGDNYRAADISDASIHGFYVDSDNNTLFALTNGDGLWSATYDGGEPEWSWE
ncbi:MAG: hypothetical protein GVY14_00550 [Spirochaetes bacterium]|jgi:hypothetical protein|nr:hypothetical protein [Spirochaetota bacterium]